MPLLYANSDKDSGLYICLPDGELQQLADWLNTVAEMGRDDLIAQRDALVEACEKLAQLGSEQHDVGTLTFLARFCDCVMDARAALALVRGEGS